MKALLVLCICYAFIFADTSVNIDDAVNDGASILGRPTEMFSDRVMIDSVGNIRAILGSQGKSIAVSGGGEAIAVIYGEPSGDPNNTMLVKVAYSLNGGVSWTTYGPFSGGGRRIYNDVAYTPNFHTNPGELWFAFQFCTQGYIDVMIEVMKEENLPAAPSFSVPIIPPNAQAPATYPWEPSIVVMQDDPTHLVLTAWSYLANGNGWAYCWISNDGGYGWSDTIPMVQISADGSAGALAAGTDEYLFYTYLDYYTFSGTDSTPYPHYTESTDGGYTWSDGAPITIFPANTSSQYWWHEFDCIVVDSEPWVVHNDIGVGGTGGPHIAKATGSPGNWTWDIWHQDTVGFDSTWIGDTLYYCAPSQYPSLSYDPVFGRVLASCKSYIYVGNTVNWAMYDGAHIQGVYTDDGGSSWHITDALSTANTGEIIWDDWNATETADWLGYSGPYLKNYSIWVLEDPNTEAGELYFESWSMPAIEETGDLSVSILDFEIFPSVVTNAGVVRFTMQIAGYVSVRVYDVSGRTVEGIFDGYLDRGTHKVDLRTDYLCSGTYFTVLQTEFGQQVEKFVVVR
ncbi:MAG: T9SS type A sorting domain-containing protein [candidate division WOR-3 bacterium]|nr:T9SS type A sorting domain-containing protein [candidate division WOR-3 bacterium]